MEQLIDCFSHAVYHAPRGKDRLIFLGNHLSQSYLQPNDHLIGVIGRPGSGKSLLIKGMFPGLNLTNDDEGINVRPLPLWEEFERDDLSSPAFHVDINFESAFIQVGNIAQAAEKAIRKNRRVVIEHFDRIVEYMDIVPDLLVGIGEEVIVARPGVFGPTAAEVKEIVFSSLFNRQMAHTAEDLTAMVIANKGYPRPPLHSDVKSGFVLQFNEKPEFSVKQIEQEVNELINAELSVEYMDEETIKIGDMVTTCTGPRIHVENTSDIKGYDLSLDLEKDPSTGFYLLAGKIGQDDNPFNLSCPECSPLRADS